MNMSVNKYSARLSRSRPTNIKYNKEALAVYYIDNCFICKAIFLFKWHCSK